MKRAFTLIELLVIIAIVAILSALVLGLSGGCSVSDGVRMGTIIKFSHKGIITKSWEGEMVQEGLRSAGGGVVGNVWRFTVTDAKLATALDKRVGKRVKVRYHQRLVRNPFTRDTNYTITSIEEEPEDK